MLPCPWNFNPRSPCGERLIGATVMALLDDFNPRSPCGERLTPVDLIGTTILISIHAPLAGNDADYLESAEVSSISIHAPLAGNDLFFFCCCNDSGIFQSTLPLRGTTVMATLDDPAALISIHAPLAGNDAVLVSQSPAHGDFNPRSPCGERPSSSIPSSSMMPYFNPRSPCGERLCWTTAHMQQAIFQSTLPLRGTTTFAAAYRSDLRFQSTLPLRGTTA